MLKALTTPHGGIRPYSHKSLTRERAIRTLPTPEKLVLPLRQHTGAPAIPVVTIGDTVTKGQCLAQPFGRMSAPIHSPTDAIVTEIVTGDAGYIQLRTQPATSTVSRLSTTEDSSVERMLSLIAQAGIVGMGGAMFPAADKIRLAMRHDINYLIINGGECEPYITADERMMQEQAEFLIGGIRYLQQLTNARQVYIGIEDNKREALLRLDRLCEDEPDIEVVALPSLYPMGSAKQLIEAVTGQQIPQNKRSPEMGVLVQNVGTCIAIFQAIRFRQPLTHRVITVSGRAVEEPGNLLVPIGTPINTIIAACGGLKSTPARMILGGPMMGRATTDLNAPITKGTSGLLLLTEDEIPQPHSSACLRCGRCVDACPMGLPPLAMLAELKIDQLNNARDLGLNSCLLCGSCSWVCPAVLPLTQFFDWGQQQLRLEQRRDNKMQRAGANSLRRQERLAREAVEKAAAKAAKPSRRRNVAPDAPMEGSAC
ncbi:electron transport complex protein RnfC|uniref:Ion-translocating oxidoreductase complex subunit C n=1 Tax=Brenneria salicis ATCC 15712 = DSM 30166 TaxID=714314 RepID=A0A366I8X6_9GAMM|nr:electron transport complex subunit RsxC [Brenneria salicis]NMN91733.1 electron transport complex protein RnfC [Brenneria salicis ATCC 15712 = DSM 30166]RBP65791.1 electron transport complex protein RnfC [Brenneria salicis ATCC 15712 = DSM 30166]RLM31830.1 electron transporter RnfC [Brenneria salicis ATCC 15712 = DSM 30166]